MGPARLWRRVRGCSPTEVGLWGPMAGRRSAPTVCADGRGRAHDARASVPEKGVNSSGLLAAWPSQSAFRLAGVGGNDRSASQMS